MKNKIGLRLEDKNVWERRVAVVPSDVKKLTEAGLEFRVERFERRAFDDSAYEAAGATLVDDVRDCDLVLGIKEMPRGYFREGGAYMCFSHTIKGQPYNMDMLREMISRKITLLDYETVTDEEGRRLIFFGRYAGLAGMIDTLWTLGLRLQALGHETPFLDIQPAHVYSDLEAAKEAMTRVGKRLEAEGIPEVLAPMAIGITGYGHVSQGAQEILDLLPMEEVQPGDLPRFVEANPTLTKKLVKVVYREEHLAAPSDPAREFDLQYYYDNGPEHRSIFEPNLSLLTVLVNGIFWNENYPKLADAGQLRDLFAGGSPRLTVVGDITCDVDGSLACTMRDTEPGDPVYVYNPVTRETPSGLDGPGLAVMAVGNLPCELPVEASLTFSAALTPFLPQMAAVDFSGDFESASLPDPIKRSVILWNGEFTPGYLYMQNFLQDG